jgi:hypothetical protein
MLRGLPPGTSPKAAGDLCALQLEKQGGGADEPVCVLTDFTAKHAEEEGDLGELSLSMWIRTVDTGAACAKYVSIRQHTDVWCIRRRRLRRAVAQYVDTDGRHRYADVC